MPYLRDRVGIRPLLLAPLALAGAAPGQEVGGAWEVTTEHRGQIINERVGVAACLVGDLDGDGAPDYALGAPGRGQPPVGAVELWSGRTGNLIRVHWGQATGDDFGMAVANAGDLDGDGVPDLACGAPRADLPGLPDVGVVWLYSGATGALIRRLDGAAGDQAFGASLAEVGDVDGDAVPDLLIGANLSDHSGFTDNGAAFLCSGASGARLRRFEGDFDGDWFGWAVAGAGDVDGDAVPDLVIGAKHASGSGPEAGAVSLYSGATGQSLRQWGGPDAHFRLGAAIVNAGDMDGDGVPELMVGAPGAPSPSGRTGAGAAYLLSGATWTPLLDLRGVWMSGSFGRAIARAGDLDGDGVSDFLIGAPGARPGGVQAGAAYLHSGADGRQLSRIDGQVEDEYFGQAVATVGDQDGDGSPELLVGSPYVFTPSAPAYYGIARLYSFEGFLELDAAVISATPGTQVTLSLDFPDREANASYLVLASATGTGPTALGGIEVPLSWDPLLARMAGGWSPVMLQNGRGILGPTGDAQAVLFSHAALWPFVGRSFHLAAVSYDAATSAGRLSSVARPITVVP